MKNSPWFATHSLNCWCYECQQTVWKNSDGKTKTDCEIIGRRRTKHQIVIFWQHMKLDANVPMYQCTRYSGNTWNWTPSAGPVQHCWIPLQIDYLDPRDWSQELSMNEVTHEEFCHEKMYVFFKISVSRCNVCRRCNWVKNNPPVLDHKSLYCVHYSLCWARTWLSSSWSSGGSYQTTG